MTVCIREVSHDFNTFCGVLENRKEEMSSTIDPAKLKVVELRAELSKRGLDAKGNKPALVKRLKEALEEEIAEKLPDTSIADTSTEDLDSSLSQGNQPDPEPEEENLLLQSPNPEEAEQEHGDDKEQTSLPVEKVAETPVPVQEPEPVPPAPPAPTMQPEESEIQSELFIENNNMKLPENGGQDEAPSEEAPAAETKDETQDEASKMDSESAPAPEEATEQKGEKRKHSPSPDRSQRRRSKSPIKEDEPSIDSEKVQLNWYDSDLHLQVDKESFLSAKPFHEGAFGFAWAGVRATHGISCGKAFFEVKITEELKWEDFSKQEKLAQSHTPKTQPPQSDTKPSEEKDKNGEEEDKAPTESMETGNTDEKPENTDDKPENEETQSETVEAEKGPPAETEKMEVEPEKEPAPESEVPEEERPKTPEPLPTHLFRVGWSVVDSGLQLGEEKFSYGYESTGKFVTNKEFSEYGSQFGVGDVIASFLSLDSDSGLTITYTLNGVPQEEALSIPASDLPDTFVLFPHVLSRNFAFELNLGDSESWSEKPSQLQDYEFLATVEDKVVGPVRPEARSECEVILMCGLPASGKTHWVREYLNSNPDKKYTVIGNTHMLEKMTIGGEALKSKYQGTWSTFLDNLQKSLSRLVDTAALRRRNYIIDQTNVFPSAQRRKLRPFEGFKRRAVVVVVGDEEQAKRQSLQEAQDGKDVPDSAVFEMKANMALPQKGEWIDEVIFAEANEEEAKQIVHKYNSQGRDAGYGIQRRFGHRDDRNRWQNRRSNNNYRGNYRDHRNYHRYDNRAPPRQGNWHPQRPGGWNRDRRDTRGPPVVGGGSRDWRNNRGGNGNRDRPNRDHQMSSYNRNRNPPNRSQGGGNWQSVGGYGGNQGNWNNQAWAQPGAWGQGGWGNQQTNQNQWKYGGGGNQGYGGYGNWNYYGQYAQNAWNTPQQGNTPAVGNNTYDQYSQQNWAQYAQQYAQQGQNTSGTSNQTTTQK